MMQQSGMSGMVQNTIINGLINAILDENVLIISLKFLMISKILINIPVSDITSVQAKKNLIRPTIEVFYYDNKSKELRSLYFRTFKYLQWGTAFNDIGVNVVYC